MPLSVASRQRQRLLCTSSGVYPCFDCHPDPQPNHLLTAQTFTSQLTTEMGIGLQGWAQELHKLVEAAFLHAVEPLEAVRPPLS